MRSRISRHARKAAAARRLPRAERIALEEEIRAHLEESTRTYQRLGLTRRRAERRAIRDFGDARRARIEIGRAFRGRRLYLFPRSSNEQFRTILMYNLRAFAFIVAIVVILRWQVVAAYHIPTKSMEPTLLGDPASGDKILVNKLYYRLSEPERWHVAVFRRDGYDQNLIKRILGLPGELLDIRDGDIFIDGEIAPKPESVQEILLVPVFRENRDLVSEQFGEYVTGLAAWEPGEENDAEWSEADGGFHGRAGSEGIASLEFGRQVVDVYPGGPPRDDSQRVGDLVLRFRVTPGALCARVGAELREGADRFELDVPVGDGEAATFSRNGDRLPRFPELRFKSGEEHRIEFANLDGRIRLEVDGKRVFDWEIPGPTSEEEDGGFVSPSNGAKFGFLGGDARFREVELYRDIHYRASGRLPVKIPDGRYFMLGDNSGNSDDSRSWGTVARDQLIGRPMIVFWPIDRLQLVR